MPAGHSLSVTVNSTSTLPTCQEQKRPQGNLNLTYKP